MLELRTPRQHLIAATPAMAAADASDRAKLVSLLKSGLPPDWPPPLNDEASARWIAAYLQAHPHAVGWAMWYFIHDVDGARLAIGNGGFKGEPAEGMVEVGYSVVPAFQRRGYAAEAVSALMDWAFGHASVDRVIAETLPELEASQALLRKLGFVPTDGASAPGLLRFETRRNVVPDPTKM